MASATKQRESPSCKRWLWHVELIALILLLTYQLSSFHIACMDPQAMMTDHDTAVSSVPLSIILGGDLLLSNSKRQGVPLVQQQSACEKLTQPALAWGTVLPNFLQQADAVVANLETPVTDQPSPRALVHPHTHFVKGGAAHPTFMGAASRVLDIVKAGHVSAVALANNHVLDIEHGVTDTLQALQRYDIPVAGAGRNLAQAQAPVTVPLRHHQQRLALVVASDLRSVRDEQTGFDETTDFVRTLQATDTQPGIWDVMTATGESLALHFSEADFAPLRRQIAEARAKAEVVVVYLHYQPNVAGFQATDAYQALARRIIDAGADMFVGQHPHHMQAFEFYKGRPLIMGAGEMLRSYLDPAFDAMEYLHQILYQVQWPLGDNGHVALDLILVQSHPQACRVDIEENLQEARARVRRINPGKVFQDTEYGLRYVSDQALVKAAPTSGTSDAMAAAQPPPFNPQDLILKDVSIVEKHWEQYNRYVSKRAYDYGQLVDVFLSNAYVCEHGDPNRVFFDIGANVGQFADMMFQLHGDQRSAEMIQYWKQNQVGIDAKRFKLPNDNFIPKVYAFEPEPANYQSLVQLAKRYPAGHMIVHHAAMADKAGTLPIYDGGGGNNSGNTQGGLIPKGNKIGDVQVLSLDDFVEKNEIPKIHLAKIDVEGFEYEVFKGMQRSIQAGVVDLFAFEYGEKWNKNFGRPNTVTLKMAVDLIDEWGFDTFLIGQFNNVKVNGDGYSPKYEDISKYNSMEMFSIRRSHPNYNCLVLGLRGEHP